MKHQISIKTTDNVLSVEDFKAQGLTKNDVIGVVLQTEVVGMVVSLDQWEEIWCSEDNYKEFNEVCSEAEALQTLSGLELTRNIVKQNEIDGESMTAAMRCWQYDKGGLQWYLPCLYELGTIIAYRDELNEVFEVLGADLIDEDNWGWSSSELNSHSAWTVYFGLVASASTAASATVALFGLSPHLAHWSEAIFHRRAEMITEDMPCHL